MTNTQSTPPDWVTERLDLMQQVVNINGGTELKVFTEIGIYLGFFPTVDAYTAFEFGQLKTRFTPQFWQGNKIEAALSLCQYIHLRQKEVYTEMNQYQRQRFPTEKKVLDKIEQISEGISDKHLTGCLYYFLLDAIPFVSGCFAPLLKMELPEKESVESEYFFCKGLFDAMIEPLQAAHDKMTLTGKKYAFLTEAEKFVTAFNDRQIIAMSKVLFLEQSVKKMPPNTDELRRFLFIFTVLNMRRKSDTDTEQNTEVIDEMHSEAEYIFTKYPDILQRLGLA